MIYSYFLQSTVKILDHELNRNQKKIFANYSKMILQFTMEHYKIIFIFMYKEYQ